MDMVAAIVAFMPYWGATRAGIIWLDILIIE
jgi:hypothetical protein